MFTYIYLCTYGTLQAYLSLYVHTCSVRTLTYVCLHTSTYVRTVPAHMAGTLAFSDSAPVLLAPANLARIPILYYHTNRAIDAPVLL